MRRIRAAIAAPLNLEMAATAEMVAIARDIRPRACCLVPERRQEVTTEGGLDVAGQVDTLRPVVAALREAGIRVSLFIDPDPAQTPRGGGRRRAGGGDCTPAPMPTAGRASSTGCARRPR